MLLKKIIGIVHEILKSNRKPSIQKKTKHNKETNIQEASNLISFTWAPMDVIETGKIFNLDLKLLIFDSEIFYPGYDYSRSEVAIQLALLPIMIE